ncbi:MAG: DUF11 domain-containing protein [Lachnospiraceae bacterium]|nr:DUF11 domain-containing protein [Lachnospiraceae bacterium]
MKRKNRMSRLLAAILTASLVFQQAGIASIAEDGSSDLGVIYTVDENGSTANGETANGSEGTSAQAETPAVTSGTSSETAEMSVAETPVTDMTGVNNANANNGTQEESDGAQEDGASDLKEENQDTNTDGQTGADENGTGVDESGTDAGENGTAADESGTDAGESGTGVDGNGTGTDENTAADAAGNDGADENAPDINDADAGNGEASGESGANSEEESNPDDANTSDEEVSMPAVVLVNDSLDDLTITVNAPEGAFPDGVRMTVTAATNAEVTAFTDAVQAQLEEECGSSATVTIYDTLLADVTFTDANGVKVQPQTNVKVTFSALDLETNGADYAIVYHFNEGGSVTEMTNVDSSEAGKESYTFTANSFSEYGIVSASVEYGVSLTASNNTATHIDIAVNTTAYLTVGDETMTANLTLTKNDFTSKNVTLTAVQNGTALASSAYSMNLNNLQTSTGEDGASQIRVGGTYPVGTESNPVYYTFSLTKDVTFTSKSEKTYTVTMTFSSTFSYWDDDNNCPGLPNGWPDKKSFTSGAGLDFNLSAASSTKSMVTVWKYVYDSNENLLTGSDVNGKQYTFTIYDSTDTKVETVTVTVGSDGIGYATTDVELGKTYYVVETTPSSAEGNAAIGDYDYNNTTTSSYIATTTTNSSGDTITTNGVSTETVTTTSASLVTSSGNNPVYCFNNYYGEDTIDVTVDKTWDDNGDTFGIRPSEVTVELLNGGASTGKIGTLNAGNGWSYTFTDLPVTTNNYTIKELAVNGYTSSIDLASKDSNGNLTYEITNTLAVGRLALTKTVVDPDDAAGTTTFTFQVFGFASDVTSVSDTDGNSWSVSNGTATVRVKEGTTVTLTNLTPGSYTVTESGAATDAVTGVTTVTVGSHTWTVDVDENGQAASVTAGTTQSVTITNTISDTATAVLTKTWDDQENAYGTRPDNDGTDFYVTLEANATDSKTYSYSTSGKTWTENSSTVWKLNVSGVAAFDTNGNKLTYRLTEFLNGSTDDYTMSVTEGLTAVYDTDNTTILYYTYTPADDVNASFTNSLETANIKVTKTLKDSTGAEITSSTVNDDDFTFKLYTYDSSTQTYTEVAARTLTLTGVMEYTFQNLPLDTYYLEEELSSGNDHAYTVTVTVGGIAATANSDGYYVIDLTSAAKGTTIEVAVTNQEQEIDLTKDTTAFPKVSKSFTSSVISGTGFSSEFSFYILDENDEEVAVGGTTATLNGSNSSVTWSYDKGAFTYTEVGTYVYEIYEDDTLVSGVSYDSTVYTLVVKVSRDSNGDLTSSYEIYTTYKGENSSENVKASSGAVFNNTYDTDAITYTMRVRKKLEGRSITVGEFAVILQEYENVSGTWTAAGSAIEVKNDASGVFSHTFKYTSTGTYYYKAYEKAGSETGMTYDTSWYWLKVVVDSKTDNYSQTVLKVTSVQYAKYDGTADKETTTPDANTTWTDYSGGLSNTIYAFTNTYKASGSTTLTAYKELEGRALEAGEFTFLLVAADSSAPMPSDAVTAAAGDTYVTDGYVAIGEEYVTATNSADGTISFGTIEYTQKDVNKTYVYLVKEVVGSADGVTYDTTSYGKRISVAITDAGNGELKINVTTTGTKDMNKDGKNDVVITNTFDQGSVDIYGRKVWVDGEQSHTNSSEVALMLYYTTDTNITEGSWKAWVSNSDGTYSIDGTGSYAVSWGTYNKDYWRIQGLPEFDSKGNAYTWKVVETDISGYTTTYTADPSDSTADPTADAEAVPDNNTSTNRYTITNIIEPKEIQLYGTKTWVDAEDAVTPDYTDITFTVTRNSDGSTVTTLTDVTGQNSGAGTGAEATYIVVWEKDANNEYTGKYNIYWYYDTTGSKYVGLPMYDSLGYAYSYKVEENTIPGTTASGETFTYLTEDSFTLVADGEYEFDFINSQPDETWDGPDKEVKKITDENGTEQTELDDDGNLYFAVGDQVTYTISYYNYTNETADITITDVLDEGVDFVSATDKDGNTVNKDTAAAGAAVTYDSSAHTVTWTLTGVEAFTKGTVALTVEVNDNARTPDADDETADIDNQATVTVAGNEYTSDLVTNPLEDDDPEDPTKEVTSVEDADYADQTKTDPEHSSNLYVSVGDYVYYEISYYNHYSTTANVTIVDVLDEGVNFVWGTQGCSYDSGTHTVTWTLETPAYTYGEVTLAVKVNDEAKLAANTYDVQGTGNALSYTDIASIANEASVTIGNDTAVYTNLVENPLDDDTPETPTKTISSSSPSGTDKDGDGAYDSVGVGSLIEYDITYYNYHNAASTITIVDTLDSGVNFISASANGVYDKTTHTVTWTLTDVTPLTKGTVTLIVMVNENAKVVNAGETTATVVNNATVQIGNETAESVVPVENPVDPDAPGDPAKVVAADSASGLEGSGVIAGDQITYDIDYYNHNNETAVVTIVDELDAGVDFVSASDGGIYDSQTHTVTWNLGSVDAFTGGIVTLTVEVNESAGDQVENDAVVKVGDNEATTNLVVNPVEEPVEPTKSVEIGDSDDTDDNGEAVAAGNELVYTIGYYNYRSEAVTVTITDALDAGVDFVSASNHGVYDETSHTVTWTIYNVKARTQGSVTLTVTVNENAKILNGTETTAAIQNKAYLEIGNEYKSWTNEVENPIDPDAPEAPTKQVDSDSSAGQNGETVTVGERITYRIGYYNNNNTAATVTITDQLDPGVTFVSANRDGVYDTATHTVTWTLENVSPFTSGSVTLTVQVNHNALTVESGETDAAVENNASVQIGNAAAVDTNTVENPVEEEPQEPTPTPTPTPEEPETESESESESETETETEMETETETEPETEPETYESSENASIQVVKNLTLGGDAIKAVSATYYVALYLDAECTERATDVLALNFADTSAAAATFTGIDLGRTYYIAECDANGNAITMGTEADGTIYYATFNNGNTAVVEDADGTATVIFENEFYSLPKGYYWPGTLTITKTLTDSNGNALNSDAVFYAGIFTDAACTTLAANVSESIVALSLAGGSTVSVNVDVMIEAEEGTTLYVAEVDANGNLVAGTDGFLYEVTVDGATAAFDPDHLDAAVTITNKEIVIEAEESEETTEAETTKATESESETEATAVQTGDTMQVLPYMLMMLAAVLVMLAGLTERKRRAGR